MSYNKYSNQYLHKELNDDQKTINFVSGADPEHVRAFCACAI